MFYFGMDHETVSQDLSRSICTNANWEHVELSPPIDNVVLKHLGMSSTLKTVSLTLAPQISRPDQTCFGPEDTPFCNVTDLALALWNSLDFATCFLRPRDQVFHSFEVTLHTSTIAMDVSAFISALASPQRIHSLQSIIVNKDSFVVPRVGISTSDSQGILVRQPLSYETFRPLVPFVYLRKLVINLDHPTSVYDEEFADLVRNWPLLEVFHFQMMWIQGEHPAPLTTLKGLLSLLVSCRKLREIGLTLDASDVPSGASYTDVCNPSITSPLKFQNSPIKHPDLVAEFLLRHLPSVPGVLDSWYSHPTDPVANDNLEYKQLWLQVNKRIGHPNFS